MVATRLVTKYQTPAIKAIGNGRVGGYLIVWGDSDTRDLQNEYFTPDTELGLDWYKERPMLYHHGLDGKMKAEIVGTIDTLKADEVGLWAEGQLDLRNKFIQHIKKMVDEGLLNWSSGSLPHLVITAKDGFIKRWPIVEGSLTPTPAEPRMTNVAAIKATVDALTEGGYLIEDNGKLMVKGVQKQAGSTSKTENIKMPPKIKAMNEEQLAVARDLVSQLTAMFAEEGIIIPEGEEEMVVDEMLEAVDSVVEEAATEEAAKAEDDEEEIDAEKSISLERLTQLIETNPLRIIPKSIQKQMNAKIKSEVAQKTAANNMMNNMRETALKSTPGKSKKSDVGGYHKPQQEENPRISVGEMQRYASLTAEEMALGVSIAKAASPGLSMKAGLTLGELGLSDAYITTMVNKVAAKMEQQKGRSIKSYDTLGMEDRMAVKAAMGFKADEINSTLATNQSAEWPTIWYDTEVHAYARPDTLLFDMMASRGMRQKDVPGKSMNVKKYTGSPTVTTVTEARNTTADGNVENVIPISNWSSDEVEVPIQYHVLATTTTGQLSEQSIIDVAQILNTDIPITMAEAKENTIINGDIVTTSSNINTSTAPPSGINKPDYLAWAGMRYNWLIADADRGANLAGALTVKNYSDIIALFDQPIQARRASMLFVIDSATEFATRVLDNLFTYDKANGKQTMFSGPLPSLFNVDLYTSGLAKLSLATGLISDTVASNTFGTINCLYAPDWQYGRQRALMITTDFNHRAMTTEIVASVGHTMVALSTNACVGGRNALV